MKGGFMKGEVFYWILNMSIGASVTGIVVMALRKIKRLPRRLVFLLWAIPFLRMWVPIGIGSKYGLMGLLSRMGMKTVVVYERRETISAMNMVGAAESYFPVTYKVNILENVFDAAFVVWMAGCAVFLGMLCFLYVSSLKELRHTTCRQDNILISETTESPRVYGIFRPQILLPEKYEDKDITYVLAHEKAHIRRKDNLWRLLGFITACVHWFNPFSWLFLKLFLEDMEFSCDETVLRDLDETKRRAYAGALVDCAEDISIFASAFGGAGLGKRVRRILSYKRVSLFATVCFVLLGLGIAYALLTNGM